MPRSPRFRYLAYLVDADGPLINSVDAALGTTNRVLESFGLGPLDLETWRQKNRSPRILYRSLGVSESNLNEAMTRYQTFFEESRHTTTSPLEVEDTLTVLKKRRVGVVSDMPRTDWELYTVRFPFLEDVEVVVTRDDCEKRKPLPNPLLLAMEKMGFDKGRIGAHHVRGLMVGDTTSDITAGRNAGLDTAALVYEGSYSNRQMLEESGPTYLIPNLHIVTDMKELKKYQVTDSLFAKQHRT